MMVYNMNFSITSFQTIFPKGREKFMNQRKKLKLIRDINNLFSFSFGCQFFLAALVSPGSKYLPGKYLFCVPQIEGIPKRTINTEFPLCCNLFFSKNTRLNYFISVSIRNFVIIPDRSIEKLVVSRLAS